MVLISVNINATSVRGREKKIDEEFGRAFYGGPFHQNRYFFAGL